MLNLDSQKDDIPAVPCDVDGKDVAKVEADDTILANNPESTATDHDALEALTTQLLENTIFAGQDPLDETTSIAVPTQDDATTSRKRASPGIHDTPSSPQTKRRRRSSATFIPRNEFDAPQSPQYTNILEDTTMADVASALGGLGELDEETMRQALELLGPDAQSLLESVDLSSTLHGEPPHRPEHPLISSPDFDRIEQTNVSDTDKTIHDIDLSTIPKEKDELVLWLARHVKKFGEQQDREQQQTDNDPEKHAERIRVREENRERKRRWREGNADRNKDNDLRCRVMRRANKIYGNENTPEKKSWIDDEFSKRRAKRLSKESAKTFDADGNAIFNEEPNGDDQTSQLLAKAFSGEDGVAESLQKILEDGVDVEVLKEALETMAGDENIRRDVAELLGSVGEAFSTLLTEVQPTSEVKDSKSTPEMPTQEKGGAVEQLKDFSPTLQQDSTPETEEIANIVSDIVSRIVLEATAELESELELDTMIDSKTPIQSELVQQPQSQPEPDQEVLSLKNSDEPLPETGELQEHAPDLQAMLQEIQNMLGGEHTAVGDQGDLNLDLEQLTNLAVSDLEPETLHALQEALSALGAGDFTKLLNPEETVAEDAQASTEPIEIEMNRDEGPGKAVNGDGSLDNNVEMAAIDALLAEPTLDVNEEFAQIQPLANHGNSTIHEDIPEILAEEDIHSNLEEGDLMDIQKILEGHDQDGLNPHDLIALLSSAQSDTINEENLGDSATKDILALLKEVQAASGEDIMEQLNPRIAEPSSEATNDEIPLSPTEKTNLQAISHDATTSILHPGPEALTEDLQEHILSESADEMDISMPDLSSLADLDEMKLLELAKDLDPEQIKALLNMVGQALEANEAQESEYADPGMQSVHDFDDSNFEDMDMLEDDSEHSIADILGTEHSELDAQIQAIAKAHNIDLSVLSGSDPSSHDDVVPTPPASQAGMLQGLPPPIQLPASLALPSATTFNAIPYMPSSATTPLPPVPPISQSPAIAAANRKIKKPIVASSTTSLLHKIPSITTHPGITRNPNFSYADLFPFYTQAQAKAQAEARAQGIPGLTAISSNPLSILSQLSALSTSSRIKSSDEAAKLVKPPVYIPRPMPVSRIDNSQDDDDDMDMDDPLLEFLTDHDPTTNTDEDVQHKVRAMGFPPMLAVLAGPSRMVQEV